MGLFKRKSTALDIQFTPTFIPLSVVNNIISGGLDVPQKQLLEYYLKVPELQAIINYKARAFAGMVVYGENDAEKEVKLSKNLTDIFKRPNPMQGFREFAAQYYILRSIFGNEFIHPVTGVRKDNPLALWNLPPMGAEVVPLPNDEILFNQYGQDQIIKAYRFNYFNTTIEYDAGEIIHFNDNQVQFEKNKILLGDSKIRPLAQACENIKSAYESRGMLITQSPRGILSNVGKDQMGVAPMLDRDKQQIHDDFKKAYGLTKDKWHIVITNAALSWQSMAADVGKMKLFEEVDADFRTIANAFNFPPELLQTRSGDALNPSDKKDAMKQLYQDAIIPEANEWLQGLANWMGLPFALKADYSHVAALQADLESRSRTINYAASAIDKLVKAGILTIDEAREQMQNYLL